MTKRVNYIAEASGYMEEMKKYESDKGTPQVDLIIGLSQEKFALSINMDRTYLASVENGKRNISIENLNKIAKGFNMSLSELLEGISD